jgi:hypothetical protein
VWPAFSALFPERKTGGFEKFDDFSRPLQNLTKKFEALCYFRRPLQTRNQRHNQKFPHATLISYPFQFAKL